MHLGLELKSILASLLGVRIFKYLVAFWHRLGHFGLALESYLAQLVSYSIHFHLYISIKQDQTKKKIMKLPPKLMTRHYYISYQFNFLHLAISFFVHFYMNQWVVIVYPRLTVTKSKDSKVCVGNLNLMFSWIKI
jgi:hypothetical protein